MSKRESRSGLIWFGRLGVNAGELLVGRDLGTQTDGPGALTLAPAARFSISNSGSCSGSSSSSCSDSCSGIDDCPTPMLDCLPLLFNFDPANRLTVETRHLCKPNRKNSTWHVGPTITIQYFSRPTIQYYNILYRIDNILFLT